jgi:HSP20 family protein
MAFGRDNPFSLFGRELDEMMAAMESRFQSMRDPSRFFPGGILPAVGSSAGEQVPALRGDIRIDIREMGDEVIIVADIPGVEKGDISLRLISPNTLQISCERKVEHEETSEEGHVILQERVFGSMDRLLVLPSEVSAESATSSFKNGVLEVHLHKLPVEHGTMIPIE